MGSSFVVLQLGELWDPACVCLLSMLLGVREWAEVQPALLLDHEEEEYQIVLAPWSAIFGGLAFAITLFSWRCARSVFLDRICIHQTDANLKSEGIMSIGAFLKRSSSFLLVWDTTYVQRLWCLLELGAYMASHDKAAAGFSEAKCNGPMHFVRGLWHVDELCYVYLHGVCRCMECCDVDGSAMRLFILQRQSCARTIATLRECSSNSASSQFGMHAAIAAMWGTRVATGFVTARSRSLPGARTLEVNPCALKSTANKP